MNSGVLKYQKGVAEITVFFPDGKPYCNYCEYCKYEEYYKRYSCRITKEWLVTPFNSVGEICPLVMEE